MEKSKFYILLLVLSNICTNIDYMWGILLYVRIWEHLTIPYTYCISWISLTIGKSGRFYQCWISPSYIFSKAIISYASPFLSLPQKLAAEEAPGFTFVGPQTESCPSFIQGLILQVSVPGLSLPYLKTAGLWVVLKSSVHTFSFHLGLLSSLPHR